MTDDATSPEAPVTGQARMDVAWGSNTGDEHPEEAVTLSLIHI